MKGRVCAPAWTRWRNRSRRSHRRRISPEDLLLNLLLGPTAFQFWLRCGRHSAQLGRRMDSVIEVEVHRLSKHLGHGPPAAAGVFFEFRVCLLRYLDRYKFHILSIYTTTAASATKRCKSPTNNSPNLEKRDDRIPPQDLLAPVGAARVYSSR